MEATHEPHLDKQSLVQLKITDILQVLFESIFALTELMDMVMVMVGFSNF
jgi:hypothetical protein